MATSLAWDWASNDQGEDGEYLDWPRVSCIVSFSK